jgi:hypothetical protein
LKSITIQKASSNCLNPNTTTGLCVVSDTIERISTARQRKAEDLKSKSEKKESINLNQQLKILSEMNLQKNFWK